MALKGIWKAIEGAWPGPSQRSRSDVSAQSRQEGEGEARGWVAQVRMPRRQGWAKEEGGEVGEKKPDCSEAGVRRRE